jgi:hypothetical protein
VCALCLRLDFNDNVQTSEKQNSLVVEKSRKVFGYPHVCFFPDYEVGSGASNVSTDAKKDKVETGARKNVERLNRFKTTNANLQNQEESAELFQVSCLKISHSQKAEIHSLRFHHLQAINDLCHQENQSTQLVGSTSRRLSTQSSQFVRHQIGQRGCEIQRRCREYFSSNFLIALFNDDRMNPGFQSSTIAVLMTASNAGFGKQRRSNSMGYSVLPVMGR